MALAEEVTGSFVSNDGVQIFYREYEVAKSKASVVFAHGLGDHSGRYPHLAEALNKAGFTVWMLDHRGHGRSGGPLGHVNQWDQYLMDLRTLVMRARELQGEGKKLFLAGHSMGGLMAVTFAIKFQDLIDGVVSCSPALGMKVAVPLWKEKLGKLMSIVKPGLTMANELPAAKISHDEEVVRDYLNDPLVHDRASARWFTEFVGAMEMAQANAPKIQIPILMQVAGDDYLVNAPSSKEFFEKLTVEDRTMKWYDGNYHENYKEIDERREPVIADLIDWLKGHLK